MKIMFFTLSLREGGAERVISVLANEMSKEHEVVVATVYRNRDHYLLSNGIRRLYIDKKVRNEQRKLKNKLQKLSLTRVRRLTQMIGREKPDAVIAFLPLPSLYLSFAKNFCKSLKDTTVVVSERCDPEREYHNLFLKKIAKKLYSKVDGFVFQTNDARKFFLDSLKCKSEIICNPIDDSFLHHYIAEKRKRIIVSCGRLEPQKNYELLIKAFSELLVRFPDYHLNIYGEGSQKMELLSLAKKLEINKNVHLMGRISDVADRIFDARLFVLSSNYEGMPNALMEAMALGIPCVSTDCPVGGPRALIEDGRSGLLVEPNNVEQMVNAMSRVASDDELSLTLSRNGRKELENYSVDKIVDKWMSFLIQVKEVKQ